MVAHDFSPCTWEAETGYVETLSRKTKEHQGTGRDKSAAFTVTDKDMFVPQHFISVQGT